jgi:hypothetical protein
VKRLIPLLFLVACAQAQVVFTPDTPATSAVPGKMVMTDAASGAPTLICTLTANAVPATAVTIACTDGGTTAGPSGTVTLTAGLSVVVSLTHGTNSLIASLTGTSTGITVQAASHVTSPVSQGVW